ncbi:MAG: tetratricopeptide repeat protein [Planctomycetes bacterium]|nr:tetratricopeptide repeat protein [Planctomycetota bacterium]
MGGLGQAQALSGDVGQGVDLLKKVLQLSKTHLGPRAPETINAMSGLGVGYQLAGEHELALKLHKETFDLRQSLLGPHHPYTVDTMQSVAMAYEQTGDVNQALKLYTQAFQKLKEIFGPHQFQTLFAMDNLGAILVKLNRPADAEPMLRESLAVRQKKMPSRWETFNVQRLLGGALACQKKYAEAEPLLLHGYTGLKERATMIRSPLTRTTFERQSLEWLVQLYEATNRPAETARWRKQLEAVRKAGKGTGAGN